MQIVRSFSNANATWRAYVIVIAVLFQSSAYSAEAPKPSVIRMRVVPGKCLDATADPGVGDVALCL